MNNKAPQITRLVVGALETNCYLVSDPSNGETVIIDPGDDAQYIGDTILRDKLRPVAVAATHGHFDHILAAFELTKMFSIPFAINPDDAFLVSRMRETATHFLGRDVVEPPPEITLHLKQGTQLRFGSFSLSVDQVPGHTPGGVMFSVGKQVMCGDTVFAGGGVGDWRHSYSDKDTLFASVRRILSLPDNTTLNPGHGDETTVEEERAVNTFVDIL